MPNQINNKLIAKNTFILYLRMIFTLAVSLFTTRELLSVLGVEDFGLYNVVGGIVLMFGFLNNAMIASSQRFISFALGKGNLDRQKKVFSTSILIHVIIAIIILFCAETIGLWFLNNKMTIPCGRYDAANFVYQAAIATFVCDIVQVPFSSSVIAHEKMSFFAWVSIVNSISKLVIVYIITLFTFDKLKLYALLLFGISFLVLILYYIYTRHNFEECRFSINIDNKLFMEMLNFAGWSFVGNFGFAAKDYGVNIILNVFCGPAVNAARGIAYQVMSAVNGFVANFQTAMNPQITKRYATGQVESMMALVKNGARYSFYLLAIIVIPLFIRAEYVLRLWLVQVPALSVQFLRLTLIMALINSMFGPFVTAMQATGKIKIFQITIALIMFMDFPVSYVLLKMGYPPYSVMYIAIITAFIGLLARVYLLSRVIMFDMVSFIKVIIKNFFMALIIYFPIAFVSSYIPQTFCGLLIVCFVSVLYSACAIYFSLSSSEKLIVKNQYQELRLRLKKKI